MSEVFESEEFQENRIELERAAKLQSEDFAALIGERFRFESLDLNESSMHFRLINIRQMDVGDSETRTRPPFSLYFEPDESEQQPIASKLHRVHHSDLEPMILFANPIQNAISNQHNRCPGVEIIFD